jgi:hypothetical protein
MAQLIFQKEIGPSFPSWEKAFHRPSPTEIKLGRKREEIHLNDIIKAYEQVNFNTHYVAIIDSIIPESITVQMASVLERSNYLGSKLAKNWPHLSRDKRAKILGKQGPMVKHRRFETYAEVKKETVDEGKRLSDTLLERIAHRKTDAFLGLDFIAPKEGNRRDQTIKRVSWSDLTDGDNLYAYIRRRANYERKMGILERGEITKVGVRLYEESRNVREVGSKALVVVPFRMGGSLANETGNYEFTVEGIPIVRNENRYAVGLSLRTDHRCGYHNGKLSFRVPGTITMDEHAIAAWLAIVAEYAKNGNTVPYHASPIPFISQKMATISDHAVHDTVVHTRSYAGSKPSDYVVREEERSLLLSKAIMHYGPSSMLTFDPKREGVAKIWQKDWRFLHMTS